MWWCRAPKLSEETLEQLGGPSNSKVGCPVGGNTPISRTNGQTWLWEAPQGQTPAGLQPALALGGREHRWAVALRAVQGLQPTNKLPSQSCGGRQAAASSETPGPRQSRGTQCSAHRPGGHATLLWTPPSAVQDRKAHARPISPPKVEDSSWSRWGLGWNTAWSAAAGTIRHEANRRGCSGQRQGQ